MMAPDQPWPRISEEDAADLTYHHAADENPPLQLHLTGSAHEYFVIDVDVEVDVWLEREAGDS